jgi:hypothetical protein
VQLRLLFDFPSVLDVSDLDLPLPCSEEEWYAENTDTWMILRSSAWNPPTPNFPSVFYELFEKNMESNQRYSEFGGYIMISGILSAILDAHRMSKIPAVAVDFSRLDGALDNWQRLWQVDPKTRSSGPSSPFGSMAFNASSVYRAASVRRVKDYSK